MSTGNVNLDILLGQIEADRIANTKQSISQIMKRYPCLSQKQAEEIYQLVTVASAEEKAVTASLVTTVPPSFSVRAKSTKNTVEGMIRGAKRSVLITGYSLSGYFADLVDVLIEKSQKGVYVKFFVNNIENQKGLDKLCRYKGRFLHIYNFAGSNDSMAALHAKVISVDEKQTLITSANLSYHGQEGNIELGILVDSREIAKQVDYIFTHLVFTKVVKEI
ncbi:phospholipase D-like domain-containing protein [uncultured Veillonella sp.]|uniref:phospholipase D-like domain-containing protein n=1 Tax=uncultured Veillonella sp. TaxID=159268 RepID=UPI0025F0E166|nr:phospholipase D-like domain-containing protein [uncultured Veillonella sp.]